ncbi:MAG: GTPase Era [Patescibacteria group bacterium]|nr:GTPase Era [Patescibacteria group bacterium]
MKQGKVIILGRPNVGKSTFLNNVIGQKVAITSPKPQTTRFPIRALYQDERGKIIFIDTPGVMKKTEDYLSENINKKTLQALQEEVDIVIYMIDHTRKRDFEEARVLGIVRQIKKPKILVINKIDITQKTYKAQYEFLKEEFSLSFEISALKKLHIKPLLDKIFEMLPKVTDHNEYQINNQTSYLLLNIDSKTFVAELIREKIFLMTGEEVPYTTTVVVDEITERENGILYIKARILTTQDRYKKMLIGKAGRKIKEIGSYARKELTLATNRKIYLDLKIETDPHWQEIYA